MKQNLHAVRDRSGSCAIVILITHGTAYVANVGDSRAIFVENNGQKAENISIDHKPCSVTEQQRIAAAGGRVYSSSQIIPAHIVGNGQGSMRIQGPMRVIPGRLSVSFVTNFLGFSNIWRLHGQTRKVRRESALHNCWARASSVQDHRPVGLHPVRLRWHFRQNWNRRRRINHKLRGPIFQSQIVSKQTKKAGWS